MRTASEGQNVASVVAENVLRLRKQRGLTVRQLSERLAELGTPLLASGITKIEQGQRKVDVNDLVALAVALDTSPAVLLVPDVDVDEDRPVAVTPERVVSARAAWWWATATQPLPRPDKPGMHRHPVVLYPFLRTQPRWVLAALAHPAAVAVEQLQWTVYRLVAGDHDDEDEGLAAIQALSTVITNALKEGTGSGSR